VNGKHINWTALANVEPEVIDALLFKERIALLEQRRQLAAKKFATARKPLVVVDRPVAPAEFQAN
jgi:hypothetical protein